MNEPLTTNCNVRLPAHRHFLETAFLSLANEGSDSHADPGNWESQMP